MIKKWLWVFLAAICVCLVSTSCTDEEEGTDKYSLGIDSFSSSAPGAMAEMRRINDAFVAEFGGETFTLSGDNKKNDRLVAERFDKVATAYTLSSDFSGYIVYCVSRSGNIIASHRFEQ